MFYCGPNGCGDFSCVSSPHLLPQFYARHIEKAEHMQKTLNRCLRDSVKLVNTKHKHRPIPRVAQKRFKLFTESSHQQIVGYLCILSVESLVKFGRSAVFIKCQAEERSLGCLAWREEDNIPSLFDTGNEFSNFFLRCVGQHSAVQDACGLGFQNASSFFLSVSIPNH